MTALYADPSALVRAYFPDEPEHDQLRQMLLETTEGVATCELARLEYASAVRGAVSAGRILDAQGYLDRFDLHANGRPITLLALRPEPIFRRAYDLVRAHRLRALDAIHLAVALEDGRAVAAGEELVFVTRDADQAAAAHALGLAVR